MSYLQINVCYHFNYFLVTGSVHVSWRFSISEQGANIFLQSQLNSTLRASVITYQRLNCTEKKGGKKEEGVGGEAPQKISGKKDTKLKAENKYEIESENLRYILIFNGII